MRRPGFLDGAVVVEHPLGVPYRQRRQLGDLAGPGLGGLLAQLAGPVCGLLADALTFLVSAACLLSLRAGPEPRSAQANRPRMIRQIAEMMPPGDYRVLDRKVTPPPRARIDESMEALIHHFKIFTEGFRVPEGEVYVAIESPRGELGCYLVSDGTSKPYRMHIRGPSFVNLQALPLLLRGGLMADAVAVISSVDPVIGEVDR